MSLIPAFRIGVWNAWIFILCFILPIPLLRLINKDKLQKISPDSVPSDQTKKNIDGYTTLTLIIMLAMIHSIFLPLKLGTTWFYVGLLIFLLGLIPYTIAIVNFATVPLDQPIIKGLYRYSRHPIYLTMALILIGVGIACASWLFLLLTIVSIILTPFFVNIEERHLLERYGDPIVSI